MAGFPINTTTQHHHVTQCSKHHHSSPPRTTSPLNTTTQHCHSKTPPCTHSAPPPNTAPQRAIINPQNTTTQHHHVTPPFNTTLHSVSTSRNTASGTTMSRGHQGEGKGRAAVQEPSSPRAEERHSRSTLTPQVHRYGAFPSVCVEAGTATLL